MNNYKTQKSFSWKKLEKDKTFSNDFNILHPYAQDENIQYQGYIANNKLNYNDCKCPNSDKIKRFNLNKNVFFIIK